MSARGEASVGVRALGFLTRCTQRSGAVFRGVSSGGGERWSSSCGGFDAVYAAFRRSVSQYIYA